MPARSTDVINKESKMKIGVIVSSNDAETSWNALRYANFCLGQKDEVKVFLTGKGVECQNIREKVAPKEKELLLSIT